MCVSCDLRIGGQCVLGSCMDTSRKIVSHKELLAIVRSLKKKKYKVAFTNGCFDILHYGHVSYLEKAKGKNRALIVALNSDKSVGAIKGPRRPIVPERERAHVIASLACVDYVTIFNEPTPEKLIRFLSPDILIKGADWEGKRIAGQDFVESSGGRVEFIRYVPKLSTTNIIEQVLKKCAK